MCEQMHGCSKVQGMLGNYKSIMIGPCDMVRIKKTGKVSWGQMWRVLNSSYVKGIGFIPQ